MNLSAADCASKADCLAAINTARTEAGTFAPTGRH
jgi:hypothetical protein